MTKLVVSLYLHAFLARFTFQVQLAYRELQLSLRHPNTISTPTYETKNMAIYAQATDAQQDMFRRWALGTPFRLDLDDSVKRQFNILAKHINLRGGEEEWNVKWLECFEEKYIWRAPSIVPMIAIPSSGHANKSSVVKDTAIDDDSAIEISDDDISSASNHDGNHWYQFEGFKPNPGAKFINEFWRLSKHMGWGEEERRIRRTELFDADFEAHYGRDVGDINMWQEFCRLCSIIVIPGTITECIEALDAILVNIYDILDHQRTGDPIVPFDDFKAFRAYTLAGRVYPIEEAKADTFLPVFLKVLSQTEYCG